MKQQNRVALIEYLKEQQTAQFEWGINDCCLFASKWVEICTGLDPMLKYRGKYSTELGANKLLKKHGDGSIKTAFNTALGQCKPRLKAHAGDIVLIDTPNGDALGILHACQAWALSPTGLVCVPFSKVKVCWSVSLIDKEIK